MKRMLLLVAAILSLAAANAAEYVTLNVGGTAPQIRTVNLRPTDLVECIGMIGSAEVEITMADGTKTEFRASQQAKYLYTGLTSLRLLRHPPASSQGVLTLKITRNGDDDNPAIPSNVAVIPNDADGQILKSS